MQDSPLWNFWHTFWTMRRAFNHMIPQEYGRVMSVSSLEGKVGKPGISIYVAAKLFETSGDRIEPTQLKSQSQEERAEELRRHLEQLRPEDFGKFRM